MLAVAFSLHARTFGESVGDEKCRGKIGGKCGDVSEEKCRGKIGGKCGDVSDEKCRGNIGEKCGDVSDEKCRGNIGEQWNVSDEKCRGNIGEKCGMSVMKNVGKRGCPHFCPHWRLPLGLDGKTCKSKLKGGFCNNT